LVSSLPGSWPRNWSRAPDLGSRSTFVLYYLRSEGYGVAFFKTSISGDIVRSAGYAFVDDTDICQTRNDEFVTGEEVATQTQGAMDAWEGGWDQLEERSSKKSFWYLIDFVWTEGTWSYASEEESQASISVRDLTFSTVCLSKRPDAPWESALINTETLPFTVPIFGTEKW
jgi:hypothetical protein